MSGNLDPNTSPSGAPRVVSGRGVRRLNRVPMLVICGVMGVVIFAIIYGFHERIQSEQAKIAASNSEAPQAGSASSALQGAPSTGLIPTAPLPTAPAPPPGSAATAKPPAQPYRASAVASLDRLRAAERGDRHCPLSGRGDGDRRPGKCEQSGRVRPSDGAGRRCCRVRRRHNHGSRRQPVSRGAGWRRQCRRRYRRGWRRRAWLYVLRRLVGWRHRHPPGKSQRQRSDQAKKTFWRSLAAPEATTI